MSITFKRIEEPFVFEATNADGATCLIDANPSIGGKNKGLRPMELLASSVAGCASIDILLILGKQKINPAHFTINIETKRVDKVPATFEEIKLIFEFEEGLPIEKLDRAISLTLEKYCSVSASLKEDISLIYEIKFVTL